MSVDSSYFPDFFTHLVARQSAAILSAFGYIPYLENSEQAGGVLMSIRGYAVNIVEGCNSISVIVLFVSFVISFAQNFKKTFLFLLSGMVLIYIVNLFRISLLIIALYKYPQYQEILHEIVFPAIIYGMVFLLWIIWVRTIKPRARS